MYVCDNQTFQVYHQAFGKELGKDQMCTYVCWHLYGGDRIAVPDLLTRRETSASMPVMHVSIFAILYRRRECKMTLNTEIINTTTGQACGVGGRAGRARRPGTCHKAYNWDCCISGLEHVE